MKYHLFSLFGILIAVLGITATAQAEISTNQQNYSIDRATLAASNSPSPPRLVMNSLELSIYKYINQYRQSRNLLPLVIDPMVAAQAKAHSDEMARTRNIGHDGFRQRINSVAQKISNYRCAAENVAASMGYRQPDLIAVRGWLKSPGHHRNIIGRYNLTGIGVTQNAKGEYYFTQIFVRQG